VKTWPALYDTFCALQRQKETERAEEYRLEDAAMATNEFDRDYIFIYGPEWGDELIDCLRRDALATRAMAKLSLSEDDVRRHYLRPQPFQRVRARLLAEADRVTDPVDLLLRAIWFEKQTALRLAS
jgi:hypothetical protein